MAENVDPIKTMILAKERHPLCTPEKELCFPGTTRYLSKVDTFFMQMLMSKLYAIYKGIILKAKQFFEKQQIKLF